MWLSEITNLVLDLTTLTVPLVQTGDGEARISGTRIPLDTVIGEFREGWSAEEIALHFPSLPLDGVYAVIAYYLRNQGQVDAYLQARAQEAERVKRENCVRFSLQGIRERLLARRAAPK